MSSRSRQTCNPKPQSGFTLLEMLVALAIFAVVSSLGYQAFDGILKARDRQVQSEAVEDQHLRALAIIQHDLLHLRPRSIRDEFGDIRPAYSVPGRGYDLEFTRGGLPSADSIPGGLQRVAYRVDESANLIRTTWATVDRSTPDRQNDQILLSNVTDLSLQQLDQLNFWVQSWPPLNEQLDSDSLPRMIRLNLLFRDGKELQRVFPGLESAVRGSP